MKKNDLREKIHLTSVDELFGLENAESSIEIAIDRIRSFQNHPFKVLEDDKMADLVESIKANGVLTPVLVRGNDGDGYEMISGHRRLHASKLAGFKKIPAFVRELSDDEATIVMVDSNIQREELLPSERAFALKMKLEAMKRQGQRSDLDAETTSDQNGPRLAVAEIGSSSGMSGTQVKRYIRLTELIPELLDLVDKKRLQFTCAVDISYFDKAIQKWLNEYIRENVVIKPIQIVALRERAEKENIDQEKMIMILHNALPGRTPAKKVVMDEKKLRKYFPEEYTSGQMERVIEALLEQWSREQKGVADGI
ncbi:MAG: ParB/RepB/Spo0J family partition protein [Lachnospiraceae bacterium]|nr:ParB/RepB/Spo0J family partition protein [Lachnospiraceae bacterium]